MATLETELLQLKQRLERLEQTVERLVAPRDDQSPVDHDSLRQWLDSNGVTARLPTALHARAARWRALSEQEQRDHIHHIENITLDQPMSEIIMQQRS